MQIWFFFVPGSGGDGIVNLFEQSKNVVSFDGEADHWRIHRIVNGSPKFYAPNPDLQGCFRNRVKFDKIINQLNPGYQQCIAAGENCVVASHDVTLQALGNSDCQDVFCKNQVRVLLAATDIQTCLIDATVKNLQPVLPNQLDQSIDRTRFDIVLDVNEIKTNWQYVMDFCKDVNLDLNDKWYLQYQDLLKGNKTYMANNCGIEEYTSQIVGNNITYTLVNIWQSSATQSIT